MSSINPSKKNDSGPIYQKTKDFFVPPLAAAISIIPVFKMMIEKSDLQRGQFSEKITFQEALKKGFKASPTVGVIVGTQMIAQKALQQTHFTDYKKSLPPSSEYIHSSEIKNDAELLSVFLKFIKHASDINNGDCLVCNKDIYHKQADYIEKYFS